MLQEALVHGSGGSALWFKRVWFMVLVLHCLGPEF